MLKELDQKLFFILNGFHAEWSDTLMVWISGNGMWIPLYLLLIGLLIKEYKWKSIWILLAIAIAVTIADQITSGFMKPYFERLRPSRDPALEGLVHLVDGYRGGRYGFASSHAANVFSAATLLFLCLRNRLQFIGFLFLWASLVAYSRIYLGVHYPLDIITGAGIGTLAGWLVFQLLKIKRLRLSFS